MGSKRSSSKASKVPSIPPAAAATPADNNFQNPRSHNPESPSNSQKKPKLSTPKSTDSALSPPVLPPKGKKPKLSTPKSTDSTLSPPLLHHKGKKPKLSAPKSTDSTLSPPVLPPKGKKRKLSTPKPADSGLLSPIPSTGGEAPSQNINRNEISPSVARASRAALAHWGKDCNLKFLESLVAFRLKYGFLPTSSKMADFLAEISDWAPITLSEKNVHNKIRHFRFMFQKNPELRPESSEYERTLHQLRLQLWGSESLKAKESAAGTLHEDVRVERKGKRKRQKEKAAAEKLNGEKQNADDDKECEDDDDEREEGGNDENEEGGDEKPVQTMDIESIKVHEKVDLIVGEDNSLLDGDVTMFPYKYLKLALEEYWMEAKLKMNTLYSALQKMDSGQAKLLDEQYSEIFNGRLNHNMEKNELLNKIICSSLGS
ncbi:hypothetical protein KSP39_PZI003406 [Platanthera zijinensis]|uniref:Uncharacterized protein n=1 Tax=Platanthera zijinensis TaxID=2320716 RepID=A0AAP0BV52_9ASPA